MKFNYYIFSAVLIETPYYFSSLANEERQFHMLVHYSQKTVCFATFLALTKVVFCIRHTLTRAAVFNQNRRYYRVLYTTDINFFWTLLMKISSLHALNITVNGIRCKWDQTAHVPTFYYIYRIVWRRCPIQHTV